MEVTEKPFRHNENYSEFLPQIEVIRDGKVVAYFNEPNFNHGLRRVWVGYKKSDGRLIVINR